MSATLFWERQLNDSSPDLLEPYGMKFWRLTDGLSTPEQDYYGEGSGYIMYVAEEAGVKAVYFANRVDQKQFLTPTFFELEDLASYIERMELSPISQEMRDEWKPFSVEDH